MHQKQNYLQPTSWLAKRLGISVTTVERLRAKESPDLPPHLLVGSSVRYDEDVVEKWIAQRLETSKKPQAEANEND